MEAAKNLTPQVLRQDFAILRVAQDFSHRSVQNNPSTSQSFPEEINPFRPGIILLSAVYHSFPAEGFCLQKKNRSAVADPGGFRQWEDIIIRTYFRNALS